MELKCVGSYPCIALSTGNRGIEKPTASITDQLPVLSIVVWMGYGTDELFCEKIDIGLSPRGEISHGIHANEIAELVDRVCDL